MKLYFENSTGEAGRYELGTGWTMRWGPWKRRTTYRPRYGADGSAVTGDRRIGSREIEFAFQVASGDVDEIAAAGGTIYADAEQTKDQAYRVRLATLIAFFRPELGPFYLIDTDALGGVGLRAEIEYNELADEPENAILRVGRDRLRFEMLQGGWEDLAEASEVSPSGGLENEDTITIQNTGPLEVSPYFRFFALNSVETVTLRNEANGQFFTYANTAFGAGSTLVVDGRGKEFLVELDGINTASALADGSGPIKLEPGENILTFESPTGIVDLEVLWRRRFPV